MRLWQGIGGLVVLGFIAVSTVMASRFGWSLGATEIDRWLYASAGALADVLKAFLPLMVVVAWQAGQYVRSSAGAVVFVIFTGYSLTSSFGLAAIQRAETIGEHAAATATYKDLRSQLERFMAERAMLLPQPVADNGEALAQAAIAQAEASVAAECARRGPECRKLEAVARAKRDELAAIVSARAVAKAAVELDARIEAARSALGRADAGKANTDADPQSVAIARLTGRSQDWVRTALHVLVAALLELGSGLGLYIVFGHHGRPRPAGVPALQSSPAGLSILTVEGPSDAIARFISERVRASRGSRIAGSDLFAAYEHWCEREGLKSVSLAAFGRQVEWRKGRVGGRVWYLDAAL